MQRSRRHAEGPTKAAVGASGREVRHIDGALNGRGARGAGGDARPNAATRRCETRADQGRHTMNL